MLISDEILLGIYREPKNEILHFVQNDTAKDSE
jgi:hypothetical protein